VIRLPFLSLDFSCSSSSCMAPPFSLFGICLLMKFLKVAFCVLTMGYIHTHRVTVDSIRDPLDAVQNPAAVGRNAAFRGLSARPLAALVACLVARKTPSSEPWRVSFSTLYLLLCRLCFCPVSTCTKDGRCGLGNVSFCCLYGRQCAQCRYR